MTCVQAHRRRAPQRGAATLVVVMVLFFLMLLVSAYAGRALIFEQRTSANQYRSAQAYEAAAGGLEWALAMLNSGQRIDEACAPSTDAAHDTFRNRYLAMDLSTDKVTPTAPPNGRIAACQLAADGWQCQCPSGTGPVWSGEPSAGAAFVVEMLPVPAFAPAQPLKVSAIGCSNARCFTDMNSGDALARQTVQLALVSALQQPPTAALTVVGAVDVPAGMVVVNQAPGGNAVAIRSGDDVGGSPSLSAVLALPGGVPAEDGVVRYDPQISAMNLRFFQRHSGLLPSIYRTLPGVANCESGDCASALLTAADNGRRLLNARGNLTLPPNTSLGSAEQPVMLVVEGTLTLQGLTTIHGLVYAEQLNWLNAASASYIRGATMVRSPCCAGVSGSPSLVYDRDVLKRLQLGAGAYAKVPGSWLDR